MKKQITFIPLHSGFMDQFGKFLMRSIESLAQKIIKQNNLNGSFKRQDINQKVWGNKKPQHAYFKLK